MITIRTDSRKIQPGDTFVAVKCEVNDGHQYIEKAIANGATKIVAEHGSYSVETEIVKDTKTYLESTLETTYRKTLEDMTIIGITGTNGKTTTAYFLYDALNKLSKKAAYIGTIGFFIEGKIRDLPNTSPDIATLYEALVEAHCQGCKYIIMETSSQGLDGGRLNTIEFDYAIFTNLTQDHLDYHKTMENYAKAKRILFNQLKSTGTSILNFDDPYKEVFKTKRNLYYGFDGGDFHVLNYQSTPQFTNFIYEQNAQKTEITLNIPGKFNVYNALACIAVLKDIGINPNQIQDVIKKITSPNGRMDTIKHGTNVIIIDYAHSPDSLEKIMTAAREMTNQKVYVAFGCTGDRDRTKRPIMMNLATKICDEVIVTIDDLHNEDPNQIVDDMLKELKQTNYEIELDRKEAIKKGINKLKDKDVLLILGKGHEEAIIIKDNQKIPFNDRQVVLEILKEI